MTATDGRSTAGGEDGDERVAVTAHQSSPDRIVFIEEDNPDAWIATDLTVDPVD